MTGIDSDLYPSSEVLPKDGRTLIVDASLELLRKAEPKDFFAFLTSARLAHASALGPEQRSITRKTVRHHFPADGDEDGSRGLALRRELIWRFLDRLIWRPIPREATLSAQLWALLPRVAGTSTWEQKALERFWAIWMVLCDDQRSVRRLMAHSDKITDEQTLGALRGCNQKFVRLARSGSPKELSSPMMSLANIMAVLRDGHFMMCLGKSAEERMEVDRAAQWAVSKLPSLCGVHGGPLRVFRGARPLAPGRGALTSIDGAPRRDGEATRVWIVDLALRELGRANIPDLLSFVNPAAIAREASLIKEMHRLSDLPKVTPALVAHHFHEADTKRKFSVELLRQSWSVRLTELTTECCAQWPQMDHASEMKFFLTVEKMRGDVEDLGPWERYERTQAAANWVALAAVLPGATDNHASIYRERMMLLLELSADSDPERQALYSEAREASFGATPTPQRLVELMLTYGIYIRLRSQRPIYAVDISRARLFFAGRIRG